MLYRTDENLTELAKELRKNQTKEEKKLWQYLKNKQINGIKFRRQEPINRFIVDFISYEKRIIIELDGGQHNQNDMKVKDTIRDKSLNKLGFKVLRYWNNDVLSNIEGVIEDIKSKL
jgi:very-short-patch-repair endonuclease